MINAGDKHGLVDRRLVMCHGRGGIGVGSHHSSYRDLQPVRRNDVGSMVVGMAGDIHRAW